MPGNKRVAETTIIKYKLKSCKKQNFTPCVVLYKRTLKKGAVTLPPMEPEKRKDTLALKQRIKLLEKSLEKANVMIYGLNAMIDYAEKELKVPVRKKHGTKQ